MATNSMVVPIEQRFRGIRQALDELVDVVTKFRRDNPNVAAQHPLTLMFLLHPWLAKKDFLTPEQRTSVEARKYELNHSGFDGDRVLGILEEILQHDRHLSNCCVNVLLLARFLDSYFISHLVEMRLQGAAQERVTFAHEEFEALAYHQGPFRRIALSHLFNCDIQGNDVRISGSNETVGDLRIVRLDSMTIPEILGETGRLQSFFHPAGTGDCFVLDEDQDSALDDMAWLMQKRAKAEYFSEVLQYFQAGVVHLSYSVPVFLPEWASRIRRNGVFFLGTTRQVPYAQGKKPYVIDDVAHLSQWWTAATTATFSAAIQRKDGKLRQAIYRAGTYYEATHERIDVGERLIALSIAIEALFSPSDQGELKFRIAQSAAQFIGKTPAERQEIFKGISNMYSRRSKLVHGSYDVERYEKGEFVTSDEIDVWADWVRRALVGFWTLYLKGENAPPTRDSILERVAAANLDAESGERLRRELDLPPVLEQMAGCESFPVRAS